MAKTLAERDFIGKGPVRYRLDSPTRGQNKSTGITLEIDYSELPVPNHYYVADFFCVRNLQSSVLLVFGKLDNLGKNNRLRTKLEVYFPSDMFVRQLWNSSRIFHEALRNDVEKLGFAIPEPGSLELSTPDKVQTIQANNVLMARSGLETVLDFYTLSPKEIAFKTRKRKPVNLEPLARIIFVGLPVLLGFLNECDSVASALAVHFPVEQEQEEIS